MSNISSPPELLELALGIALQAGELLMKRPLTFQVTSKSVAIDIATQMDQDSERFIVDLRPSMWNFSNQ